MNVVIMGCGRLGSTLAAHLDAAGHSVTVMDIQASAFKRLPPSFGGTRVVGNGMDDISMERAGIRQADAFIAVTQGDNRNYFASQLAKQVFNVDRVLCRIYDQRREIIFRELGIETYSPTAEGSQRLADMLLGNSTGAK